MLRKFLRSLRSPELNTENTWDSFQHLRNAPCSSERLKMNVGGSANALAQRWKMTAGTPSGPGETILHRFNSIQNHRWHYFEHIKIHYILSNILKSASMSEDVSGSKTDTKCLAKKSLFSKTTLFWTDSKKISGPDVNQTELVRRIRQLRFRFRFQRRGVQEAGALHSYVRVQRKISQKFEASSWHNASRRHNASLDPKGTQKVRRNQFLDNWAL